MSRLIDADALEDSIIEKWGIDPKYLDDSLDAAKDAQTLEWINSAPTIEPKTKVIAQVAFDEDKLREIVHEAVERIKEEGEWIEKQVKDEYSWTRRRFYCSACGSWNTYGMSNYCPNCGARMKGANDETEMF